MGVKNIAAIAAELVSGGLAPSTPVAGVADGAAPLLSTLADVAAAGAMDAISSPAVFVVGAVAAPAPAQQDLPMPDLPDDDAPSHVDVPRPVRVAADWSWRLLAIAGAVVAVLLLVNRLKLVFLSVFVGLLVAALLAPSCRSCSAGPGSRGLATAIVLVVAVAGLAGVMALLAIEISGSFKDLGSTFSDGLKQIRVWLRDNFNVDDLKLQEYLQQAWEALQDNRDGLLSGALSGATIALEVLSGAAIAFFTTVFFLLDGDRIWAWCVSLFPRRSQPDIRAAGARSGPS